MRADRVEPKVELERGTLELMKGVGRWALEQKGLSKDPLPDFRARLYDKPLSDEKRSAVRL